MTSGLDRAPRPMQFVCPICLSGPHQKCTRHTDIGVSITRNIPHVQRNPLAYPELHIGIRRL